MRETNGFANDLASVQHVATLDDTVMLLVASFQCLGAL